MKIRSSVFTGISTGQTSIDRGGEGLLAIDFDDMLNGPPVQDIWFLFPIRRRKAAGNSPHCWRDMSFSWILTIRRSAPSNLCVPCG
ncbi:MAG: hypothetical protein V8T87_04290 [Victivallales bacterium]